MKTRTLESERLYLKPLSMSELYAINRNQLDTVDPFIEEEAILESTQSAISKKIEKMILVGEDVFEWYTYWLIIEKCTGHGIGLIGFKGLPDENGCSEIGYGISPNHRKEGLMTEALKTLVEWAHRFQDCKGIAATVKMANTGSKKVLSNCHFKILNSTEQEIHFILNL